jgi:pectin methylesterase-like acyl-CoA thioesterase
MDTLSKRIATPLILLALFALGGTGCSSSSSPELSDASSDSSRGDALFADRSSADTSTSDTSSKDTSSKDGSSKDGSSSDGPSTDASSADGRSDAATDGPLMDGASSDGSPSDGSSDGSQTLATTGLVNARTVPVTASPLMTVLSGAALPTNNATGVPVDTLLRIGFDAAPVLGTTGTISIHQVSDGSIVDTISLADPYAIYDGTPKQLTTNTTSSKVNVIGGLQTGIDQVRVVNYVPIAISGNTAVIFPHNNKLAYRTAYYVTIDSGVFTGAISGTTFTGVSSATSWTFTTKATAPTTLNVAADDSADFATVQGAVDAIEVGNTAALTINIAAGVYQELLFVRKKENITFLGMNNGLDVVIQYDNCDGLNPGTGSGQTVTAPGATGTIPGYGGAAAGNLTAGGRPLMLTSSTTGIVLNGITLLNMHGQGSLVLPTVPTSTTITTTVSPTYVDYTSSVTQAETVYFNTSFTSTTAPGTIIAEHSNFISYQDTLQLKGFSWFYDTFVTGDTDFIWGNANAALFERCELKSRYNTDGSSIVQSRAYLGYGSTTTPANLDTSYPGFVFLNSALTKEAGTFTAYLARSSGAATYSGTAAPYYYLQYDIVSYIGCTMDTHIAPVGWNVMGSNPPGANVLPNPVAGWREYGSMTPAGQPLNVSQRLVNPAPDGSATNPGGSLQLTAANVATFFPSRTAILGGATDGTYITTGLATFNPTP